MQLFKLQPNYLQLSQFQSFNYFDFKNSSEAYAKKFTFPNDMRLTQDKKSNNRACKSDDLNWLCLT